MRYHLATAIVAIGCEYPEKLAKGGDALAARLDDGCAYVRGRVAEAVGLLARTNTGMLPVSETRLEALIEDRADSRDSGVTFATARVRFALVGISGDVPDVDIDAAIGSLEAIREHMDEIVEDMTTSEADECPHCGLALPENAPPMCPRCGAPY